MFTQNFNQENFSRDQGIRRCHLFLKHPACLWPCYMMEDTKIPTHIWFSTTRIIDKYCNKYFKLKLYAILHMRFKASIFSQICHWWSVKWYWRHASRYLCSLWLINTITHSYNLGYWTMIISPQSLNRQLLNP